MAELQQIDIFNTVFNFVEQYDPKIKSIRIYGILDENGRCNEPYFMAKDVIKYLKNPPNKKALEASITGSFKKFSQKEVNIQKLFSSKYNRYYKYKTLTKYGLIRCMTFCNKDTRASICFLKFIHALLKVLDEHITPSIQKHISKSYTESMNTPETQQELKQADEDKQGLVYFIKNLETQNIKIGFTKDLEARLSCLQVGNDCELKVIHTIEGEEVLEKEYHQKFADYHVRGEWFKITEEQVVK